ncbi:MAG: hypothetical protein GY700_06310, partial [Propionibacteriaceae bacterium]|nr:hypothetical protein [Propionibacteriaceae bacterium]
VDQQHIEGINCFDDLARFNEVSYSKFVDYDDPAGSQHTQMSEFTARQILQLRGIYPSPGEESAKRRVDVTRGALLARHGTDLPGIVISESGCPYLYEAIRRGYRYPPERYGVDSKTIPMKDGLFEHPANGLEYVVTSIHDLDREKYGQPKVARNSILGMRQARERARWANEPLRL